MQRSEEEILKAVKTIVEPHGCTVNGLGPDAVGVKGDARFVGPSVFVYFPPETDPGEVQKISTEITNKVREISRVLQDIFQQPQP